MTRLFLRVVGSFILVLCATLSIATYAYTSPGRPTGYVNDFAGLLTEDTRVALAQDLSAYDRATGNEIAIALIPSLGDETIETYAVRLFEEWQPGKTGKDTGVLLLIARDDRKIRIEVGYGLEGVLNDARAGRIIRDIMTPAFRDGNYDRGVTDGVRAIRQVLDGSVVPEFTESFSPWWSNFINFMLEVGIFILFGLIGILGHILGKTKSWWLGGVLGGVLGLVAAFWIASILLSAVTIVLLTTFGFLIDFSLSKNYAAHHTRGNRPWWWGGGTYGGGGGFGSGGFGGFGGGSSGGGGASGSW